MIFANRILAHILIAFLFGYIYKDVGIGANTILANYCYMYGSLLLVVYTGQMSVTISCKYFLISSTYVIKDKLYRNKRQGAIIIIK